MEFIQYMIQNKEQILSLVTEHIELTAIAVGCSILVGVPLGILISYVKNLNKPVLGVANVVQAIPSMALLGLSIPLLGIGTLPAGPADHHGRCEDFCGNRGGAYDYGRIYRCRRTRISGVFRNPYSE